MHGLNKVTLIGNLGNDPEVQRLQEGVPVAKFSLATTESYKDAKGQTQSTTDWHFIVLWRGLAELAEKYLHKGSLIYVEGKLKTRTYDDKELYILKGTPVESLDAERLRSYFLYCINTLKLSENTLHSRINAVKFFVEQVLHRERFFFEIPRPKRPTILPKAISPADIKQIFTVTTNLKHNTMLKLCYGMGLRVSELLI